MAPCKNLLYWLRSFWTTRIRNCHIYIYIYIYIYGAEGRAEQVQLISGRLYIYIYIYTAQRAAQREKVGYIVIKSSFASSGSSYRLSSFLGRGVMFLFLSFEAASWNESAQRPRRAPKCQLEAFGRQVHFWSLIVPDNT